MYPNLRAQLKLILLMFLIFPSSISAWEEHQFDVETLSVLERSYLEQAEMCNDEQEFELERYLYNEFIAELKSKNIHEIPLFVYLKLGNLELDLFDYDAAFHYFSLILDNPNSSKSLQASTLSSLAQSYSQLGDNNLAHEYFIKVIKLREEAGDEIGLIGDFYSYGSLSFYQKNYNKALENYKKTLVLAKKHNNETFIYNATSALGATYEQIGELAQSLVYNAEALKLAKEQNYDVGISYAFHNFGSNYAVQNNHEKALEYFDRSLATKKANDKFGKAGDYIAIGKSHLYLKNYAQAKESLEKALQLGIDIKAKTRIASAHEQLAKVYKGTGNLRKENECLNMYIAVKDSMLNEEAIKEIRQREYSYKMAQNEKQIIVLKSETEILKAEKRVSYLKNIFWILAFCSLAVVVVVLFYNWKKQQNMARLLQEKHYEIEEKNEKIQIQNRLLEQSNVELQNFAYVASHDLKEPLRMVNSFSGLLKRKYNDVLDDRGQEYMYYITDAVDRMGTLLDDLLDYSRVTTSDKNSEAVNTGNVAAKVRMNLTPRLEEKSGDVIINYDKMPEIQGNKSQFGQLLQNLISNGLKFQNGKPPVVEVDCQERKKDYLFSVKDNGIGISKENQAKVFDMFTRLHTREQFEGTGIGLSTCKKIVNRHGGKIWVESEVGQGATFFFTVSKQL